MRYKTNHNRLIAVYFFLMPFLGFANEHESGLEDSIAEVVSWIALIVAPIAMIGGFLFVHVLPEKIAEKRNHPQTQAIKVLCFLSLIFGGLLWPLAWLWAYSKPVFYKMAYGTDQGDYHETTMKEFKEQKEEAARQEKKSKKEEDQTNTPLD